MVYAPAAVHVALLAVSAAITATLSAFAWRRRSEPGVLPFALLMAATTVWSASYALGLVTLDPRWRPVWEAIQWFGTATIPVWFVLFALEYTGYDRFVTWRHTAALLVLPVVTVAFVWTNSAHELVWVENRVVVVDGLALMVATYGPWFWVYLASAYAMTLVGAALITRLVFLSEYLYADQSALLVVGTVTPLVGNVVSVFVTTPGLPGIDLTPYAFVITGLSFGYALFRRRLFDLVPATRTIGRTAAIRDLEDGIIVVDTDRHLIYCNPAAAEILDAESTDVLGEPARALLDESVLSFDDGDGIVELERGDRVYGVRTSPITDRRDRLLGHTLVVSDVTARKRRERRLESQRDELARLEDLNAVVRGVNRALVSATDRDEIEQAVCDRLTEVDRYRLACVADIPTWDGDADRWTVAGDETATALPTWAGEHSRDPDGHREPALLEDGPGTWLIVPLVYGRTVYGALGLYVDASTATEAVPERERTVLSELGELIGQSINAVENRRLLAAEGVLELEFYSTDDEDPLVAAASATDCRLELTGFVPAAGDGHVAYVRVEDGSPESVADALSTDSAGGARVVRTDESLIEWHAPVTSLLGTVADHGANVCGATVEDGAARLVVEVAAGSDVRALSDRLRAAFDETRLAAKRERNRPADRADSVGEAVGDLTSRQQEALEVAFRAGYFDWPRESTAEEVAATLDISAPTLHAHLRKAEGTLLTELFDAEPGHRE